jgi:hypothetical protein
MSWEVLDNIKTGAGATDPRYRQKREPGIGVRFRGALIPDLLDE